MLKAATKWDCTQTAMVNSIRQTMSRTNEARRLLKSLYAAEADLVPDYEKNKLTVRLHRVHYEFVSKYFFA